MVVREKITSREDQQLEVLWRATRAANRRLSTNAVLRCVAQRLPIPLVVALVLQGLSRLGVEFGADWKLGFVACCGLGSLPLFVGFIRVFIGKKTWAKGALALDRHHGFADVVTNTLAFSRLEERTLTAWTRLAIDDGLRNCQNLKPASAVPVRWPQGLGLSVGIGLCVMASALWPAGPAASHLVVKVERSPAIEPKEILGADDIGLLAEAIVELARAPLDSELAAGLEEYRSLVEQLAARKLSREQLFRRLDALDDSLGADEQKHRAVGEGLKAIAKALSRSKLSKTIAQALEEDNLTETAQAMRQLAEKLGDKSKTSSAQRQQLRKALSSASEQAKGRLERLEATRSRLSQKRRRLLKKKTDAKPASQQQRPPGSPSDRRLERLNRRIKAAGQAQQALSELDRQLAAAAQSLLKAMGQSAQSLQRGAGEVEQLQRQQMTRQQKLDLKKQLERMRELVRKAGQGGPAHRRRMEKFAKRARGGASKGDASAKKAGQGKAGPGAGKGKSLAVGVGIRTEMQQRSAGATGASGGNEARKSAAKAEQVAALKGRVRDVSATALDTGNGLASSEVVFAAAEQGFSNNRYRKVYTDYQTVAEEVLDKQGIPAGYESSVRRYFQLIRPRESE